VVAYIENVVKMWLGRVVITEKLEYSNDRSINVGNDIFEL
jgi:hypothetical protein